ncbi:hypothetical protein CCACVL1_24796 [Corchorus capsularis]|uniref:Uncharacterized protein n=1 Tax=Corchorus capsularis TaxID=210143 RepID=A0A1R3GN20_COCAP|nr:hypothetical protein CCACVL1_24796 [Corchorus capsularis]
MGFERLTKVHLKGDAQTISNALDFPPTTSQWQDLFKGRATRPRLQ